MTTSTSLLLVTAGLLGCASRPDASLGTADYSRDGVPVGVTTAWAVASYSWFDDKHAFGRFLIQFAKTGASLPCSERPLADEEMYIDTPQVFARGSSGQPTLSPGDIPVVGGSSAPRSAPPAMAVSEFYATWPEMTSGMVTITSADSTALLGTFDATGTDEVTTPPTTARLTGSFDATICPPAE